MPTKQTILDNVGNYTPPQLVEYIRSGVVTYEELCNENDFSYTARSEVERLLEQQPVAPKPEPEPQPEVKKVGTVALKTTVYTYNGKVKKPREKVYMPFITVKVCYDVPGIKKDCGVPWSN